MLIGKLCFHYGVSVFDELKDCIFKGIRENIEMRDLSAVDSELMEKLGRQDSSNSSSSEEDEELERVSII